MRARSHRIDCQLPTAQIPSVLPANCCPAACRHLICGRALGGSGCRPVAWDPPFGVLASLVPCRYWRRNGSIKGRQQRKRPRRQTGRRGKKRKHVDEETESCTVAHTRVRHCGQPSIPVAICTRLHVRVLPSYPVSTSMFGVCGVLHVKHAERRVQGTQSTQSARRWHQLISQYICS